MARQTREEKQAARDAAERTQKVNEFKRRVDKARSLKVYNERQAFEDYDRSGLALFELVRRFKSTGDDIRRKTLSLVDEMQRAMKKLDDNYTDVFSYSNPLATPGSDIEQLHATRKALRDGIATLAYALGYHVPQIMNVRELAQHNKLLSVDVLKSTDGREMWRIEINGTPVTGVDLGLQHVDAANPLVSEYTSEESAWLAAATHVGEYSW